jgi:hypothetical protein
MSFPDYFTDPEDPASTAAYPRGLALDLVLEVGTLKEILDSYAISPEQFSRILTNPTFRREYEAHQESMQTEGWSFRKKCQAQAELYLNLIFRLASSDNTPAAVRADLMKSTVKWAGLETPANANAGNPTALLGDMAKAVQAMPDDELELRVTQLVLKRTPKQTEIGIPRTVEGVTYDAQP